MNNNIYDCRLRKLSNNKIKLVANEIKRNLPTTYTVTLKWVSKILLILVLATVLLFNHKNPEMNLAIIASITLIFNLPTIFVLPWFVDLSQQWLYKTRWVSLAEFADFSPEIAELIKQVCLAKSIKQIRLGIINDQNPVAFVYGSLNSARLVVSKGLFVDLKNKQATTASVHQLN
jgi:Zn-dependent protease with chaperone function